MNPYKKFPDKNFWGKQVANLAPDQINYDAAPKFQFDLETEKFATAGSCFAQHFARELVNMGGKHHVAEPAHPLLSDDEKSGYGLFSARYGNVYTARQLRELLEQAFGIREPVIDFAQDKKGKWFDLLRPRVSKHGFSSYEEALRDRLYHLKKVKEMFSNIDVFVFTLGLTELWHNTKLDCAYPICPGTAAGEFNPDIHQFHNQSFSEVHQDLADSLRLILENAPKTKILLTVSPVMLVATAEERGALQSSIASKSILRAVADQCCREFDAVDYFPSFEIITGPQARGRFFTADGRDVLPDGVNTVMGCFFRSRVSAGGLATSSPTSQTEALEENTTHDIITEAFEVDCDEILLNRS